MAKSENGPAPDPARKQHVDLSPLDQERVHEYLRASCRAADDGRPDLVAYYDRLVARLTAGEEKAPKDASDRSPPTLEPVVIMPSPPEAAKLKSLLADIETATSEADTEHAFTCYRQLLQSISVRRCLELGLRFMLPWTRDPERDLTRTLDALEWNIRYCRESLAELRRAGRIWGEVG